VTAPAFQWRVYLSVRSSTVTPQEVNRLLGLSGDRSSSADHRRWPHLWELDSGEPADVELDEHLDALVRRCRGRAGRIAALADHPDTQVTIEAVLHFDASASESSLPGIWFAPHVVQFAADCGIGIDTDVYFR